MPTDADTTISELIETMSRFVAERDWQQFHSPKNLAMGLAVEAAELMELFQWMDLKNELLSRCIAKDPDQLKNLQDEMADVLSYLLCLADVANIDLTQAFHEKMKANNQKYPADKYRGKYKL